MRSALLSVIFALLVAPLARADDAPKDYEIKLVRPPKLGQKYTVNAEGALTRSATIKIDDQLVDKTDTAVGVRLEGTVKVLEVNKDGEESKVACTVAKCVRIAPEGETELLPAGRVITATGGKEDTSYSIDTGVLSDEAKEALDLVLRMGEDDGYNDDRIYGTKSRQPVGGSWPVDTKAAAEEAKADGVEFDPRDIDATLKLERVETVEGVECLRIAGETRISRFTAKAPAGMTFDHGSLKARYGGVYPVDEKLGTLAESMSATHTETYKSKDTPGGKQTVIESTVHRATEMKRKFLD